MGKIIFEEKHSSNPRCTNQKRKGLLWLNFRDFSPGSLAGRKVVHRRERIVGHNCSPGGF